jgi:hypothetical protein
MPKQATILLKGTLIRRKGSRHTIPIARLTFSKEDLPLLERQQRMSHWRVKVGFLGMVSRSTNMQMIPKRQATREYDIHTVAYSSSSSFRIKNPSIKPNIAPVFFAILMPAMLTLR